MKKLLIVFLIVTMLLSSVPAVFASNPVMMGSMYSGAVHHAALMTIWCGVGAGPNGTNLTYSIANMDYLELEVYFSHPEQIQAIPFCFELTSSGTCDVEEDSIMATWPELVDLKAGWNTVRIPLSAFPARGCDRSRFNFLRIFSNEAFQLPDGVTLEYYFRKVAFGTNADGDQLVLPIGDGDAFNMRLIVPPSLNDVAADAHTIPLFDCSVQLGDFSVDTADYKAGGSSLSYTLGNYTDAAGNAISTNGQASFQFQFNQFTGRDAIDVSKMDTLEFWLYVSDVKALEGIHFADNALELTSGGTCDREETNWRLSDILPQCKDGWNAIRLPFLQGGTTGDTDWTRLNYMRFYFVNAQNVPAKPIVIKIDNIRLTDYVAQESGQYRPQVEALHNKIKAAVADIPAWDRDDAEIVAQYAENCDRWQELHDELLEEYDALPMLAQALAAEMTVKKELNSLNRWLDRYADYLKQEEKTETDPPVQEPPKEEPPQEQQPEWQDPNVIGKEESTEPGPDNASNTRLLLIIAVIAAVTMVADVIVYVLLRKKDRNQVQ